MQFVTCNGLGPELRPLVHQQRLLLAPEVPHGSIGATAVWSETQTTAQPLCKWNDRNRVGTP